MKTASEAEVLITLVFCVQQLRKYNNIIIVML